MRKNTFSLVSDSVVQESRAVARKPRDAAAVIFSLKFAVNIHYNFYPRDAMLARVCDSDVCVRLSVCPDVRPTRAGIVPSRAKAGS